MARQEKEKHFSFGCYVWLGSDGIRGKEFPVHAKSG